MNPDLPIGIFDSGVGGLTVYRALHEQLPEERFVYLGDTARVPYGTKSLSTVERYAIENARFLEAHGLKLRDVAATRAAPRRAFPTGRSPPPRSDPTPSRTPASSKRTASSSWSSPATRPRRWRC